MYNQTEIQLLPQHLDRLIVVADLDTNCVIYVLSNLGIEFRSIISNHKRKLDTRG